LCDVLGLPGLPSDPRFVDNAARVSHRDELTATINAALAGARSIAAWFPQTAPTYCDLVGLDPEITRAVRESYRGGEFQEAAGAASLLPVSFVQRMAVAGNRDRVTAQLAALRQVGVDSISILPMGDGRMATINAFDECWRRL
jgi:5,10-methylenetetrahydromethanopterin reductase